MSTEEKKQDFWIAGRLCDSPEEARHWIDTRVPSESKSHWVVVQVHLNPKPVALTPIQGLPKS